MTQNYISSGKPGNLKKEFPPSPTPPPSLRPVPLSLLQQASQQILTYFEKGKCINAKYS